MANITLQADSSTRREYQITLVDSGICFSCQAEQNVLAAMMRLGQRGIPLGCRGGGCGICRVQVVDGGPYHTLKMSRVQVSAEDLTAGICLACKLIPEGPLTLRALGLLRTAIS